jgi:hypothetical protein
MLRPGRSIGVARGQLEIPLVGANSVRTVNAAAWVSNGRGQQHVALVGVALAVRNSHQIRPHLPWVCYRAELLAITMSSTLRRNELGAIASDKNDCNFP